MSAGVRRYRGELLALPGCRRQGRGQFRLDGFEQREPLGLTCGNAFLIQLGRDQREIVERRRVIELLGGIEPGIRGFQILRDA